jgi:hypothetical protein
MLVNTEGGRCYAPEDIKSWLLRAGLKIAGERLLDDGITITGLYSG